MSIFPEPGDATALEPSPIWSRVEILAERRYGRGGRGQFNEFASALSETRVGPGILVFGRWQHQHRQADFCRLYYNQQLRFPNSWP